MLLVWRQEEHPACKKTEWWGAGMIIWSEVQICIWLSWCHCHSLSLASVKSRLFLPFWYWLTLVVPEKGPLNECINTILYFFVLLIHILWTVLLNHCAFSCIYFGFPLICRCPECAKLEQEFAKAAVVLKDHDPPVIFAKVGTSNHALYSAVFDVCSFSNNSLLA